MDASSISDHQNPHFFFGFLAFHFRWVPFTRITPNQTTTVTIKKFVRYHHTYGYCDNGLTWHIYIYMPKDHSLQHTQIINIIKSLNESSRNQYNRVPNLFSINNYNPRPPSWSQSDWTSGVREYCFNNFWQSCVDSSIAHLLSNLNGTLINQMRLKLLSRCVVRNNCRKVPARYCGKNIYFSRIKLVAVEARPRRKYNRGSTGYALSSNLSSFFKSASPLSNTYPEEPIFVQHEINGTYLVFSPFAKTASMQIRSLVAVHIAPQIIAKFGF